MDITHDYWTNGELRVQVTRPRSISTFATMRKYLDLCWTLWQQGYGLTMPSEPDVTTNLLVEWLNSKQALLGQAQTSSQPEKQLKEALAGRSSAPTSTTPSSSPNSSSKTKRKARKR
ncbi:MAG: hypothetical protein PGMFKBFP_00409 [Anaerolineales bacterium]|nr:hypothetical protein [Anaerolineales bacterium]